MALALLPVKVLLGEEHHCRLGTPLLLGFALALLEGLAKLVGLQVEQGRQTSRSSEVKPSAD